MDISEYSTFRNNPIFYTDPRGDTVINGQKMEGANSASSTYVPEIVIKAPAQRIITNAITTVQCKCHADGQAIANSERLRIAYEHSLLDHAHGQVDFPRNRFLGLFEGSRTQGRYLIDDNGYLTNRLAPVTGTAPTPSFGPVQDLELGEDIVEGSFSIFNWDGYPSNGIKPIGPFRLLEGDEYETARKAANAANDAMHKADPSLQGLDIHEIQPVKFGGSPTDPANKIYLSRSVHSQYTVFWNRMMRSIKK